MKTYGKSGSLLAWGLALVVATILVWGSTLGVVSESPESYFRLANAIGYSIAIWSILFAIAPRIWVALVLASPAAILFPAEIWQRVYLDHPTSSDSIALLAETSPSEINDFLATFGGWYGAIWLAWALFFAMAIFYTYRYQVQTTRRARWWCLVSVPAILVLQWFNSGETRWIAYAESVHPFERRLIGWGQDWQHVYPINIQVAIHEYILQSENLRQSFENIPNSPLNAHQNNEGEWPDLVILVIGESSTASRWSLFGYKNPTNPLLKRVDGLIGFSDVVSLSNATRTAIPGVISRRPALMPNGEVDPHAEGSIVAAFREVGYRTHWISNQSPYDKHGAPIAIYAAESHSVRFVNPADFGAKQSFDEKLLSPLKEALDTPGRHLVILHTLGSHFDYRRRYPKQFEHFNSSYQSAVAHSDDKGASAIVKPVNDLSSAYDNSILYTDFFLTEVINVVNAKNRKSLVAYFSDHGEDLPTLECAGSASVRRGATSFHVPVLFWFSEKLRESQPDSWSQLNDNRNSAYSTRAMHSSLLTISGISLGINSPQEETFLSKPPKKVVRNVWAADRRIDFNKARSHNSCNLFAYGSKPSDVR